MNLIDGEIRENEVKSEIATTRGAVILVAKVSCYTHVTVAMAASSEEGVLHHLHAYRADQIPVDLIVTTASSSEDFSSGGDFLFHRILSRSLGVGLD